MHRRVAAGAVLLGAVLLAGGSLAGGAGGGQGSAGTGPELVRLGKRPPSPVAPQTPSPQTPAVPPAPATPPKATPAGPPVPAAAPEVRSAVRVAPDAAPAQERPVVVGKPGDAEGARSAPAQLPRTGARASDLVVLSGAAMVFGGVSLFVGARSGARRVISPG